MAASLVVQADGTIYDIELPSGDSSDMKRQHIGCRLIDVLALTDRIDMWIDEEGYGVAPVNQAATALAQHYGFVWQNYHGAVVLCGVDNATGESVDLQHDQIHALLTRLLDIAA